MIVEEQGEAGGVVDELNKTYSNLAGRSLETGYFHEAPDNNSDHHGKVSYVSQNETGRDIGHMFAKHITDHGGERVKVYNDPEQHAGTIHFNDGNRRRVARYIARPRGLLHTLKFLD